MKRILAALALTLVAAASLAADDLDRINTKPVMARMTRGPFVPVEASGSPTAQRIEFYRAVTDVIQSENGTTSTFQPACSDLTAICALTTTAYGRGLLECTANTDCKTYLGIAGGSGGLGDVVGPASATDNALCRYDLTTGKLIQNSVGILGDTGALTGLLSVAMLGSGTGGAKIAQDPGDAAYFDLWLGTPGSFTASNYVISQSIGDPVTYLNTPGGAGGGFQFYDANTYSLADLPTHADGGGWRLYGTTSGFTRLRSNAAGTNADVYLPNSAGTLALAATTLAGYGITDAQPLDSDLTSIAALSTTSYGRSFLTLADAAAARTYTGLVIGTDVEAHDADLTTIAGLTPSNDDIIQRKAGAWTNRTMAQLATDLGLAGTYQPLDSDLTSWAAITRASGFDTFTATPSSANLATLVTDDAFRLDDIELAAIAGLTSAADKLPYFTGSGTAALADFSAFGRSLVDDAAAVNARTTLGLAIGTNVQAWDADLDSWAAITRGTGFDTAAAINVGSAGAFVTFNGALGTPSSGTLTNATGLPISTGVSGLAAGIAAWLADPTSAKLATAVTNESGSGLLVFNDTPTLIAPLLGTPTSGVLTNCTGTAAGLTAGTVTTNANLTGPVTSVGNATTIADAELAALAGLTSAADKLPYFTGSGTAAVADFTAAARTVLDDTTVSAMVDTLGGASATGTGALVRKTNAALVTPDLGTPSAAVLTSATGLPLTTGVTGTLPTANGGTNKSSAYAVGDVVYASGTTTLAGLADVATGSVLISGGVSTAPSWSANPPLTTVVFGSASGGTGTLSQPATASVLSHTLPDDSARLVGRVAIVGTTNTAAITAGTLYTPNSTNMYRVSFVLTTLRAATTSSIMGAGVNLNYTTGDGSVAVVQNVPMESQTATTGFTDSGDATNTVGATLIGNVVVYALTSVAMTYDVSYTSVGGTTLQYQSRVRVEKM